MSEINDTLSLANGGLITKGQIEAEIERRRLRDHFAGLAMQAMLTHPNFRDDVPESMYASAAYAMADAMLKERGKEK